MKALVSSKRVALLHDEDNVVLFNNPLNIAVASSKIDLSMTTSSSPTTKKKNELFGLLQGGDENENVYAITKTGLVIDLNGKEIGTLKNKIYSIARQGGEKEFRYLCVARTKRATLALCSFELSKQKVLISIVTTTTKRKSNQRNQKGKAGFALRIDTVRGVAVKKKKEEKRE